MKNVTIDNLLAGSFYEHPQDYYVEVVLVKQGDSLFVRLKNGQLVRLYYGDTGLDEG